jgi:hypothetical protein
VNAKRAGLCQLRDLLITTPEPLRSELRPLSRARLLRRLSTSRPHRRHDPELRGTLPALRALARRIQQPTAEERELAQEIEQLISTLAPQTAQPTRNRPTARRPDRALPVTPRPPRQRGRLRPARRRRANPRLVRPDDPLPTRPQRRQTTQPRTPPDRPHPTPNTPTDHRLHRASRPRRKQPPRGHPLPQALPRPHPLPTPRTPTSDDLTNIEASPHAAVAVGGDGESRPRGVCQPPRAQSGDHVVIQVASVRAGQADDRSANAPRPPPSAASALGMSRPRVSSGGSSRRVRATRRRGPR